MTVMGLTIAVTVIGITFISIFSPDATGTITLLVGFMGVALVQLVTSATNAEAAKAAAKEVAEVKTTLQETNQQTAKELGEIKRVGDDTHTLVNSNMAVQLRINKAMAVRLAGLSRGTPDEANDLAAVELATKVLAEHEAKQRVVDGESV